MLGSATLADPVSAAAVGADQVRSFAHDGFVVLRNVIPPDAAGTLRGEVMAIMDIIGLGQSKLRQTREYLRGSALDAFVNSPNLRQIAEQLLGGEATLYMPFTAVKSGGGGGAFHYHQDNQYTRFDGPGINIWFALTPATVENGCLNIVPRSHLNGTLPSLDTPDNTNDKMITFAPDDFVPLEMAPGDCVAFSRLTVHGSGPNISGADRVGYAVQFHRDDVNFSVDDGRTWTSLKQHPRWDVAPVDVITPPPEGKVDGH